ncbi:MAG TPA: T9SS type A sorting domain-containing protein, partial [Panacibacter sp.]|nr:T9SS type A sorting domain-containing protein [Panacibacter sp.]
NKVYKFSPATNRWTAISGDLTNGPVSTNPNYGTITALAVASSNNQYIYSGADDGSVYVTRNGGSNWTKITNGLPALWAMFIRTDSNNPEVAYIGFSGNRYGIEGALLYKTTDAGANWLLISNDLPQVPVNDLVIDAFDNHRLYIATDIGVFYSGNTGTNWIKLGTGMPAVVTTGLYYAPNSKMLYAATYGRSIYKTDLNSILPLNSIKLSLLKQSGNNILLQWQSSFIYMQGKFEAEQSTDAVHFTKIGEVMQEKDDVFINYKLNATPAGNHVIYYRIKFISADGKTNYSAVTVYKAAGNNSLKLYPNPVSNLLQVSLPLSLQHAIINVYNTNGAKMFTQKIAENILQTTLDVSRLPAGIYILECSGDNMLFKEKFVVTR